MLFRPLFDPDSSTYTYLLADRRTHEAVLIDAVLGQVDRDSELLQQLGLSLKFVLDTHVHADHITAAGALRERFGARSAVSAAANVRCADRALHDFDTVEFGRHALVVRHTPGHTAGDLTFIMRDDSMAFTGDTLLIRGCGRTDFQQGDARALYRSVHSVIFALPDETRLYPGHDYRGRTVTTVGEEKRFNPRLGTGRSEAQFVAQMRELQLAYPRHIDHALPANEACGRLPAATTGA